MQAPIRPIIAISEIRNQSIVSFQRFQPDPAFRFASFFLGGLDHGIGAAALGQIVERTPADETLQWPKLAAFLRLISHRQIHIRLISATSSQSESLK
jgi:hypothetical protein